MAADWSPQTRRLRPTSYLARPLTWPGLGSPHALAAPSDNSYSVYNWLPALDPAIFDKPYDDGRYLCNVPGCPVTFKRKADRNRHVEPKHNNATLHLCPVRGCVKSLGKPYTRKDKLQEHMWKKHAGLE
ncbi:hypothetical protein BKA61DRAFT_584818 [Leptodontidium sp. MPI-SDFR-AT-0119]|nr:hypothetical protein BKA61DRAFT_584818 [Leptodontidium sp. MPI-SDFR-AT-0119]